MPTAEKGLFIAAIVYVISPIDLIPDIFPFIGQVDDIYMVALTLLRLVNRTDEKVVRELWPGGGDIVALADSIAGIAPMLLPKRVARVLTSRVELHRPVNASRNWDNRRTIDGRDPEPEQIEVDSRSKVTIDRSDLFGFSLFATI